MSLWLMIEERKKHKQSHIQPIPLAHRERKLKSANRLWSPEQGWYGTAMHTASFPALLACVPATMEPLSGLEVLCIATKEKININK